MKLHVVTTCLWDTDSRIRDVTETTDCFYPTLKQIFWNVAQQKNIFLLSNIPEIIFCRIVSFSRSDRRHQQNRSRCSHMKRKWREVYYVYVKQQKQLIVTSCDVSARPAVIRGGGGNDPTGSRSQSGSSHTASTYFFCVVKLEAPVVS